MRSYRLSEPEGSIDATDVGKDSQLAAEMLAEVQSSLELVWTSFTTLRGIQELTTV